MTIEVKFSQNAAVLLSYMGTDSTVESVARCSTQTAPTDDREKRRRFYARLADAGHHGPWEHVVTSWFVNSDKATHTQFVRHRMMSFCAASMRYQQASGECWNVVEWQGMGDVESQIYKRAMVQAHDNYRELRDCILSNELKKSPNTPEGRRAAERRANELARMAAPAGLMVAMQVTCNLRSLAHFCRLRLESGAQPEIRTIARQMSDQVLELFPDTWNAIMSAKCQP